MHTPLCVLIVEDLPDDAELLRLELRRGGYDVATETVDTEAEYTAAIGRGNWDIILCDHGLPRFNSLKALHLLQERGLDIPFIIVSGLIGEETAVSAMKAGASDYIMKDNLPRLVPAVQRELREAEDRRARRQAEEQQARLIAIIEATPDFVGISDSHGRLIYLNAAGRMMLGVPGDASTSTLPLSGGRPAALHNLFVGPAFSNLPGHGPWSGESLLVNLGGREIPVSQVTIAHRGAGGAIQFYSTIARDISERKEAERALQEANRQLQEALAKLRMAQQQVVQEERIHALQKMAGAVVHDVNNLLTPITGFSSLLLGRPEYLSNAEQVHHNLQMVNTAAKDAASVMRRLSLFYQAQGDSTDISSIDLNVLVNECVELTEPRWRAGAQAKGVFIDVVQDLHPVPSIEGSKTELREVLTNLIFNAVDAMESGGVLTLVSQAQDNHVLLQVRDMGVGMSEDVLQRCTEPFFTTKGSEGTGLGLAVVFGVVERHHGRIHIDSKLGQGTTVTIHLPLSPSAAAIPEGQQGGPGGPPLGSLRILAVDDELSVRQTILALLTEEGHVVDVLDNGEAALERLKSERFDLLITDLAMPAMNGFILAKAAKEIAADMPVVLLSGFAEQIMNAQEKTEAVAAILAKPIDMHLLRQTIAQVLGRGTAQV